MRHRPKLLLATLTLAACAAPGARPVPFQVPEDRGIAERLSAVDDVAGRAVLTILADPAAEQPESAADTGTTLTLDDVMDSVESRFPLILAALESLEIAAAEQWRALGAFDTRLRAGADVGVQGFYENERVRAGVEQPLTTLGATLFGGYELGDGDFPVWEGGDKTRTDGEVSLGLRLPLLRGRAIDDRRLALWQARLARDAAEPDVQRSRLDATRRAARAYWDWVAAGQTRDLARRVLELAQTRQSAIERSVEEGELAPIATSENRRLVVEREAILVTAERELERAALALSLFWRDANGAPILPGADRLPTSLPEPLDPSTFLVDDDVEIAQRQRPEPKALSVALERLALARSKASNDLLPTLDVALEGSQDLGDPVTAPDDKGPFEVKAWVSLGLPVQRRAAFGRARELDAERRRMRQELQLARDRISIEVEDARSAVRRSWERIERSRENVSLAGELERSERTLFDEGESDLFRVNLRERQTAAAASTYIDLVAAHFRALADYRASLGVGYR